jgi:hypothetical protein
MHTSDDLPFDERLFTAKQTRQILAIGKTTFFRILPELKSFLDGNRLKITGRSIREYREKRLAAPRVPRLTPSRATEEPKELSA